MKRSLLLLALSPAFALAADYSFSVDNATQLATVAIKLDKPSRAFNMPAWAPGDYEIFNYGQYVKSISFKKAGQDVSAKQEGLNRWIVPESADEVTYKVAPSRANFTPNLRIKENEYYASGPGVLGWFDGATNERQVIHLASPEGWTAAMALAGEAPSSSQTFQDPMPQPFSRVWESSRPFALVGLDAKVLNIGVEPGATVHTFSAPNYDVLIDSPFVVGTRVRIQNFEVAGKPHAIVAYNQSENADLKGFSEVGAKIADAAHDLFGEFGYDRYMFFLDLGGQGGGLEHLNCTRIGIGSRAQPMGAKGIMAHEYFHNFNVKRIRAKALGPFDYSKPAITGTLWWLEGVTDYYADVLQVRAGLQSHDDFVRGEIGTIRSASQGKYLEVSGDEASRKVWDNKGSYGYGGISYYERGHAAGAVLDLAIRSHSNGKRSLDDVIKQLWAECKGGKPGYADDRIRELCIKFGGEALGPIYDASVMKPGPLPIDDAIAPWNGKMVDGAFQGAESGLSSWPMPLKAS